MYTTKRSYFDDSIFLKIGKVRAIWKFARLRGHPVHNVLKPSLFNTPPPLYFRVINKTKNFSDQAMVPIELSKYPNNVVAFFSSFFKVFSAFMLQGGLTIVNLLVLVPLFNNINSSGPTVSSDNWEFASDKTYSWHHSSSSVQLT